MRANLSILGLYNYNEHVFDGLVLPAGIDRDVVINNICMELAELEVIYADPNFMQQAIEFWSKKEGKVWSDLYFTTQIEYNPIDNYDRSETWSDNTKSKGDGASSNSGSDKTFNNVAAFNNNNDTMTPASSEQVILGTSNTANSTGEVDTIRTGRAHGNIGVTTTQQMLEQERKINQFNMVDYIVHSFKKRFCLLVY